MEIAAVVSGLSLTVAVGSAILALRSDRRARESVRPYVSTGVHILPDDMCVTLSNYGAGVAIINRIAMSRGGAEPKNSLAPLLPFSPNYDVSAAISFVQKEYCLRPGDDLSIAKVTPKSEEATFEALSDWADALDGIKIEIGYSDIFGKQFRYERAISTKTT